MSFMKYATGGILEGMAIDSLTKSSAPTPIPPPPAAGPTNTVTAPRKGTPDLPKLPTPTDTTEKLGAS